MNRINDIREQIARIEGIRYENPNGGSYAYLQFLAYSRELLRLVKPVPGAERLADKLEGVCWIFNENLGMRFTHAHRSIYDKSLFELRPVFHSILELAASLEREERSMVHEMAA